MADPRDRQLQTNAADPRQRKYADRISKHDHVQLLEYVRVLVNTAAGRAVLMHLLYMTGVSVAHLMEPQPELTADIWDNSALIHRNAGKLWVGHYIQGLITQADPDVWLEIVTELRQADKTRTRQNVASRMEHSEV